MSFHRLPFCLILLGLALPASAQQAGTPPPVEVPTPPVTATPPTSVVADRLTFLLSGYEYFPTRVDLDAVGSADEIAAQLRTFALDEAARPSLRLRAVDALGYYDDEATVALLTRLCTEPPQPDLERRKLRTAGLLQHHAITALARAKRADAVPVLETVFATHDTQLTLTAVHALGKHGGEEGRAALARLAEQSQDKMVTRELRKWVP